ncbi:hypothetical protein BJ741DRAFT_597229 [Chytriomyces cf. hyalinus JEL632]|nr:hypothetical protein BJ741DRAFT_597229 [Chytriomyces cf. hyalinus JEL632]
MGSASHFICTTRVPLGNFGCFCLVFFQIQQFLTFSSLADSSKMSTVAELMPKYIRALEDRITLTEQLAIERASVERLSVQVLNLQSEVQLLLTRQAMAVPAAAEKTVIEVFDYAPPEPIVQPERMKEPVQRPSHGVPVSLRIPPIIHVAKTVAAESKPAVEYCEVINLDEDEEEEEEEVSEEDEEVEEPPKVAETEPADKIRSRHSTDTEKKNQRSQSCPATGCSKIFPSEKLLAQHINDVHADATVVFQDGITDVIKREKESGWLFCRCSDAYLSVRTMMKHATGCTREKRNLPFECIQTDCFRKFSEKASLRSHQSSIHEDDVTVTMADGRSEVFHRTNAGQFICKCRFRSTSAVSLGNHAKNCPGEVHPASSGRTPKRTTLEVPFHSGYSKQWTSSPSSHGKGYKRPRSAAYR